MESARTVAQNAIRELQREVEWKPNKALPHLEKRIALGHLAQGATLEDYEAIIRQIVSDTRAEVFVYLFAESYYPTIVADVEGFRWLVMVNEAGILETAFPPDNPASYLTEPGFIYLGRLQEVML